MTLPLQPHLRRALALLCALAVLSGGPLGAVIFGEGNAYKAAKKFFDDGFWEMAEANFGEFIAKHPKSERVPDAVLGMAQAQYFQATNHLARQQPDPARRKLTQMIDLLTAHQAGAGFLADQYVYWIGEGHFQNGNYIAAAEAFGRVVRDFPVSLIRLEAVVEEAAARAKSGQWPQVIELLEKADGPFQTAAQARPEARPVARGRLLLGEARLMQKQFAEAETAIRPLSMLKLEPELEWQRQFLICRALLGAGKTDDARHGAESLVKVATTTGRRDLIAESVALLAAIHQQLGQRDQAIEVYKQNFPSETPAKRQREALLKVTELTVAQGRLPAAIETMETFLGQFSNAPATDTALLTLGNLHLQQYLAQTNRVTVAPTTNHLQLALDYFNRLVTSNPNSALIGNAQLGRGRCFWISTNVSASVEAFRAAVATLPPSEDLAEARCRLADALFARNEFPEALQNYASTIAVATNWPRIKAALVPQALYKMVHANLALTNTTGAAQAMRQLLELHPGSDDTSRGLLAVGQGFLELTNFMEAQALFKEFIEKAPAASERPVVELLLARSLEQESKWTNALVLYNDWLERFATNALRPQAEFHRALATFHSGNETNALNLFNSFVTQFATNDLAPVAQWWIAAYYYDKGEFYEAEKNYKMVFQNWESSDLAYPATMMAGRAAVGRPEYTPAIEYFKMLTGNTNCPAPLRIDAMFAYGGTLMLRNSSDTNNPSSDLNLAIRVFGRLYETYPDTEHAAQAWGEIGNCYRRLSSPQDPGSYLLASNAYQQAIITSNATVTTRSQAEVGLGLTLELQARLMSGDQQNALLKQALENYLNVVNEKNLNDNEKPVLYWVKTAGWEAARLAESMQEWAQAVKIYQRLEGMLPVLKPALDHKIQKAQEHLAASKN